MNTRPFIGAILFSAALLGTIGEARAALSLTPSNAVSITRTNATLYCGVSNTESSAAFWFYWGTNNQSTNAALWSNTNAMGASSSSNRTVTLSNLTASTTYYWVGYATNGATSAWSSVTNFTTLTVPSAVYAGVMVNPSNNVLQVPTAANFRSANDIASQTHVDNVSNLITAAASFLSVSNIAVYGSNTASAATGQITVAALAITGHVAQVAAAISNGTVAHASDFVAWTNGTTVLAGSGAGKSATLSYSFGYGELALQNASGLRLYGFGEQPLYDAHGTNLFAFGSYAGYQASGTNRMYLDPGNEVTFPAENCMIVGHGRDSDVSLYLGRPVGTVYLRGTVNHAGTGGNVLTQNHENATFSGTTQVTNLNVDGAQTNTGSFTLLGGGNVVTTGVKIAAATNADWSAWSGNSSNAISAGSASTASYAGYSDYSYYLYGVSEGLYDTYLYSDGMWYSEPTPGTTNWIMWAYYRTLYGSWTNTGHFVVESNLLVSGNTTNSGSLTVLGAGGNVVTQGMPDAIVTGTLTPTNYLTVSNTLQLAGIAADRYITNLAGGYFDAYSQTYQVTTYSLGTITVSRTWGNAVCIALTNNCTIQFDMGEWPTNSMGSLAVSLHPNGFSTTFETSSISTNGATNTIPGSAGLALQTNTWNLLTFAKGWGWTNWGVRQ